MWMARVGNVIAWVAMVAGLFAHVAGDRAPAAAAFVIDGPGAICRPAKREVCERLKLDLFGSIVVVEIER